MENYLPKILDIVYYFQSHNIFSNNIKYKFNCAQYTGYSAKAKFKAVMGYIVVNNYCIEHSSNMTHFGSSATFCLRVDDFYFLSETTLVNMSIENNRKRDRTNKHIFVFQYLFINLAFLNLMLFAILIEITATVVHITFYVAKFSFGIVKMVDLIWFEAYADMHLFNDQLRCSTREAEWL